jgi:hypothetical protein
MARKRKQRTESLLARALAPFAGALVTTRSRMAVKVLAGSTTPVFVSPTYWEWDKGQLILFVGVETEGSCEAGNCRGWLKVVTPQGYGWISPSATTQLELISEAGSPPDSPPPPIP